LIRRVKEMRAEGIEPSQIYKRRKAAFSGSFPLIFSVQILKKL
jgi:hypothetical protein